jgi:hypothetical protein
VYPKATMDTSSTARTKMQSLFAKCGTFSRSSFLTKVVVEESRSSNKVVEPYLQMLSSAMEYVPEPISTDRGETNDKWSWRFDW